MNEKTCQECGSSPLPKGRSKFCSKKCQQLAADKRRARRGACMRCGGDKGYGVRGGRLCEACRDAMRPVWAELERERSRIRSAKKRDPSKKRRPKINDEGLVWCQSCYEYRPRSMFSNAKKLGLCRDCHRTYHHRYRLKAEFGMTLEQYHDMFEAQEGRCAICRSRPRTTRLAVDHDHGTGQIRGLLCKRCNKDLLGAGRESPDLLRRAANYLEAPPGVTGVQLSDSEDALKTESLEELAVRQGGAATDGSMVVVTLEIFVEILLGRTKGQLLERFPQMRHVFEAIDEIWRDAS